MANRTCSLPDCDRRHEARDLCHTHYERLRRHGRVGDPALRAIRGPEEVRLWGHVEKSSGGCWLWTGTTTADGYGRFRGDDRVTRGAHRVIWEATVGAIPPGMQLDHRFTCPKRCVNPAHLRVVTGKQNSENRSRVQRNNTSGHPNVSPERDGWRVIVTHNRRRIQGGHFKSLDAAAAAALALRLSIYTHNDIDRQEAIQ